MTAMGSILAIRSSCSPDRYLNALLRISFVLGVTLRGSMAGEERAT